MADVILLRPKWVMQYTIVCSWFTWKCVQLFLLFISLGTITKALLRRHWQLQRHLISCMPLTRFSPSFLTWSQFTKLKFNKFYSFLAHLPRIHYKELAHIRIIHYKELHNKMHEQSIQNSSLNCKERSRKIMLYHPSLYWFLTGLTIHWMEAFVHAYHFAANKCHRHQQTHTFSLKTLITFTLKDFKCTHYKTF